MSSGGTGLVEDDAVSRPLEYIGSVARNPFLPARPASCVKPDIDKLTEDVYSPATAS